MSYLVKPLGFLMKKLCWEVNFTVNSTIQLLLQSCRTDFAKDCNLKAGYVCVFEKLKSHGFRFNVCVFQNYTQRTTYLN